MFNIKYRQRIKGLEESLQCLENKKESLQHKFDMKLEKDIAAAIKKTEAKNIELEKENAVMKKESEIYNKAFEEMGLDIKDTKEIINALLKTIAKGSNVNLLTTGK